MFKDKNQKKHKQKLEFFHRKKAMRVVREYKSTLKVILPEEQKWKGI